MSKLLERTKHQQRVEEMMRHIPGQTIPDFPTHPDGPTAELRARLILEEALETVDALGVTVTLYACEGQLLPLSTETNLNFQADLEPNLVEIADGCADISVVTTGTLSACGIPDKALLRLVDENNLAKFGGDGHLDEGGKWVKPTGHKPPDVEQLLTDIYLAGVSG